MKKLFAFVFGLFAMTSVYACNFDVQNCVDLLTPDIVKYNGELKNNAAFMNDSNAVNAWQARTDAFKQKVDMCATNKCVNQKFLDYHNYVVGLVNKYRPLVKQQASTQVVSMTPAASTDKWADQCVVGKNPKVFAYTGEDGAVKTAIHISEYTGYKVTQANGGKLVALTNSENGQFTGWVKKSELQMQDLRNCN